MPPHAAMTGSKALRTELSSPTNISCLISIPTPKKKMAIRASFTKAISDMGSPWWGKKMKSLNRVSIG